MGHGRGDGNIFRVHDHAEIYYSGPINFAHLSVSELYQNMDLKFGIGSIPHVHYEDNDHEGMGKVSLRELTDRPCLYYKDHDNALRVLSWDQLIHIIANKFGAVHSDKDKPQFVIDTQRYKVYGTTVIDFLLCEITMCIIQEVLEQERFDPPGVSFGSCSHYATSEGDQLIEGSYYIRKYGVPLLELDTQDREYIV